GRILVSKCFRCDWFAELFIFRSGLIKWWFLGRRRRFLHGWHEVFHGRHGVLDGWLLRIIYGRYGMVIADCHGGVLVGSKGPLDVSDVRRRGDFSRRSFLGLFRFDDWLRWRRDRSCDWFHGCIQTI